MPCSRAIESPACFSSEPSPLGSLLDSNSSRAGSGTASALQTPSSRRPFAPNGAALSASPFQKGTGPAAAPPTWWIAGSASRRGAASIDARTPLPPPADAGAPASRSGGHGAARELAHLAEEATRGASY
eukprot:scaffold1097_cov246-Pinguiococcus_pyrenoidosus.AAC.10